MIFTANSNNRLVIVGTRITLPIVKVIMNFRVRLFYIAVYICCGCNNRYNKMMITITAVVDVPVINVM